MLGLVLFAAMQDAHTYKGMSVDLNALKPETNLMVAIVDRFSVDRRDLDRVYDVETSPTTFAGRRAFYSDWMTAIQKLPFDTYPVEAKVDWVLLRNRIEGDMATLDIQEKRLQRAGKYLPDLSVVTKFIEDNRQMMPIDPRSAAEKLTAFATAVGAKQSALPTPAPAKEEPDARFAADLTDNYRRGLKDWYDFFNGYDPNFSWWCKKPWEQADAALDRYVKHLRERVAKTEGDEITGDPVGREALLVDLQREFIAYTPEELIEIANKEFAWCEREMIKQSNALGFGNDWKAALEHVKGLHEEPGGQPQMIKDLAWEAVDYLEKNDLVTIPDFMKRVWRMEMMSAERQKVSPFFLGGQTILVSFPTDTMTHDEKLMSMRGNNRHFAKATVHHELIPGHHMQGWMNARYNTHRAAFRTPFWTEGWALWWEFLLYERNFPSTPEDKVGFLFWRMHRCARIIFSLRFHLGEMTPQECVDFLVEKVGHERANAEGEVRRSFGGQYVPLYQLAYMTGALQLRSLYKDLVRSGRMSDRQFHDTVLQLSNMPMDAVRMVMTNSAPTRDYKTAWKFYVEP
jgi:hypothetical protein